MSVRDLIDKLTVQVKRSAPGFALGLACGLIGKDLGLRGLVSYWGPVAPIVLLSAILGAALWPTRLRSTFVGMSIVFGALWILVAFSPLVRMSVAGLVRVDPIASADAIFVLSSNMQADDEPSEVALTRASRGLELLGEGRAPRLYFSELRPPAGSSVRWARATAHRMGMAQADAIYGVGYVANTHDEAVLVAALFKEHGWRKLLLVTSPTHSRRSAETFERAGVPEVISVPSMETVVDVQSLAISDGRIDAFGMVAHEWLGLWVYRLRGWR